MKLCFRFRARWLADARNASRPHASGWECPRGIIVVIIRIIVIRKKTKGGSKKEDIKEDEEYSRKILC